MPPATSTLEAGPVAPQKVPDPEVRLVKYPEVPVVDIPAFEAVAKDKEQTPDIGEFADLLDQVSAEASEHKSTSIEVLVDPEGDPRLTFAAVGLLVKDGRRVTVKDSEGNELVFDENGHIVNAVDEVGVLKVALTKPERQEDETPESHLDVDSAGVFVKGVFASVSEGGQLPSRVPEIQISGDSNETGVAVIDPEDSLLAGLAVAVPRIKKGRMVEIKTGRPGIRPLLIGRPAHM